MYSGERVGVRGFALVQLLVARWRQGCCDSKEREWLVAQPLVAVIGVLRVPETDCIYTYDLRLWRACCGARGPKQPTFTEVVWYQTLANFHYPRNPPAKGEPTGRLAPPC